MWAWACVCLVWAVVGGVPLEEEGREAQQKKIRVTRQQPAFGITHLDIRDAILILDKSIKDVGNKLNRHEAREAQVADFTTRALGTLTSGQSESEGGMQAIARQLASMEERILSIEALIQTVGDALS